MTEMTYHVNGELVPASNATVNVRDRGFMYGDAAFETMRIYGGTTFRWEAHAERLERTCETLGFASALPSRSDLRDRIDATLEANDLFDASVKLSISRGVQPGKLTPGPEVDPTIVVTAAELPRGGIEGTDTWDEPARLQTVNTRRVPNEAIPAAAKTHNYLNGILARLELGGTDFHEAILQSVDGYLTEGATTNLFFVQDETLKTPTLDLPVLPGITAAEVRDIADKAGIQVETGRYEPAVLNEATEVFVTNSSWEVRPVERVDDIRFEIGPVTDRLRSMYDERVESLY